ncbi:MAG: hypothetical protein UD936_02925, partial [Acutalibacteraceae bacterium]|nr:hypothetical protein [Acutalibacteraceae bacterium]
ATTLNATGGTYTFTYDASTNKLTVAHAAVAKNVKLFGDLNIELAKTATANVYSATKELQAGKYTFKVNEFGTELGCGYTFTNQAIIAYNSAYKAATTLNATGGTYTFSYNASTDKLTVTYKAPGVRIFGDLNLDLAKTATANVYSATVELQAGKYTFKINDLGTEMGFGQTFTNTASNLKYSSSYKSSTTLNATGGTYTFTYNASTDTLTVTYKAPGVKIFGDLNFDLAKTATANVYSAKVTLQAGKYTFKVNELGTELGCGYTFTDNATISYNSAYKAATTLNATGGSYTFNYNVSTDKLTVIKNA